MYLIKPYEYIGELQLLITCSKIEQVLGKCELDSSAYEADYLTGVYSEGIIVSYKNDLCCYIGVNTSLQPVHIDFYFSDKTYAEVIEYFRKYPGDIYIEEEVSVFSDFLGIGIYFEDGIKEVSICSKEYAYNIIKRLKRHTSEGM